MKRYRDIHQRKKEEETEKESTNKSLSTEDVLIARKNYVSQNFKISLLLSQISQQIGMVHIFCVGFN